MEDITRRTPSRRFFRQLQGRGVAVIPPLWVEYQRAETCLGPLTGDTSVAGHTTAWRWDQIASQTYGGHTGLRPQWSWYPTPPTAAGLVAKMQPIRFAISDSPGVTGSYPFYQVGVNRRQRSALTAPATANGHFSGSLIGSVVLGSGALTASSNALLTRIVAARVWIDGVDVSGVQTIAVGGFLATTINVVSFGRRFSPSITIPLTTPQTVSSGKSLWIDVWCEHDTRANPVNEIYSSSFAPFLPYGAPVIGAHESYTPPGNVTLPVVGVGQINIHRSIRESDTWTVSFTGATVGGASSLTMQPQANWSYSRQGPVIQMTKTSGSGAGDKVLFRYDTECPIIEVQIESVRAAESPSAQTGGWMRYNVESPSFYNGWWPADRQTAPITVSTSSTFVKNARGRFGTSVPYVPIENAGMLNQSSFPTSLTLSR